MHGQGTAGGRGLGQRPKTSYIVQKTSVFGTQGSRPVELTGGSRLNA
jgi:hypothetical protein